MFVTKRNGTQEAVKFDKITTRIKKLIRPEEENFIDPVVITQKVIATIFSGITTTELDMQSAEICVNLSTVHHYYTNLAGRILVSNLHKTTTSHFVDKMTNIQKSLNFLDEKWLNWIKKNKKEINAMIDYERDYIFDYFGFKTLERAYLIKIKNDVIERPQDVYMRVASFLNQGNLEETKKTYDMLSMGYYTHATPTLFNSGNKRSQLSSCFLLGTDDSLEGITHTWDSVSKISKWGGGIGLHVSNIRAKDSLIKGTNGPSSGIIPMLKVYNEIARYINQGGKRKGSIAIYLEPWHPDILAFLDLRKNFGAETERARDLFLALWIPDLFMKKVQEDGDWYTFCPDECPGLTDAWGEKFEALYNKYVEEKKFKNKYEARKVMKAILESQLETGTPYMLFKDTANRKSNQQNIGTIKSSNLCAEILLYSDDKEYAVCNLASIAVNQFVKVFKPEHKFLFYSKPLCKNSRYIRSFLKFHKFDFEEKVGINDAKQILPELLEQNIRDFPMILYGDKKITSFRELFNFTRNSYDFDKLEEVAYIATKNLDRVIDVNYYPTIETKFSNMKHRPIGIGIQGLADAIVKMKIQVDSDEAVNINGRIMESIYYACLKASNDIAKSRHEKMQKFIASNPIIPEYYDYNLVLQDKELNQIYHELLPCKFEMKNKFPGTYSTYESSPFSQGILQFDMWNIKPSMTEKWAELKKEINIYGVRNSQLTALMPTATTSQILGNNECFEFFTNNIYTRRTLAGDFPLVNSHLVDDLNSVQLWSPEMKDLILSYNGSINEINGIPEEIKKLYPTIWEIKQSWILKSAIARGPYVDQTQSMNIFMGVPDYQKLYSSHMFAWTNGLKTAIYYLRTRPAQDAIKFTIDTNIQKQNEKDNIAQQLSDNQTKEKRFKKPEEGEVCDVCSS
jgi:ribonucleoside-diphosphate reductase subunit M1